MKHKLPSTLFLIVLTVLSFSFNLIATVTVNQNVVYRVIDDNARFTLGADIDFYKTEVNASHLWLDQSYTTRYYTRYCIYVFSPSNMNLTINTWFSTANSSGTLTITAPTSTNINLGFYSPNLISASVYGAVTSAWHSGNQTLTLTVNTDTSATFTISATVTQTEEINFAPENVGVNITDMEGCGNWVFSEEQHYTFQAQYWDGNGYADLDTMKINFSDSLTTVVVVCDRAAEEWTVESGGDIINLQAGRITVIGSNTIQVTFLIRFLNTIIDAFNVDIYSWCNETSGAVDGWDLVAPEYFNIYNLGGHATYVSSGNAGRLDGGDVFDLYAYNNSWIEATMNIRNLQHIKMLPIIWQEYNASVLRVDNFLDLKYTIDYCINDVWLEGWAVNMKVINVMGGGTSQFITINVTWTERGTTIVEDQIRIYHTASANHVNTTWRIWVDLWFNKINASSTVGGRVNAYYYAMFDSSPAWLRWLTGSNWGIDPTWAKQSMFFGSIRDSNGDVAYTKQIEMTRVKCNMSSLTSLSHVNIPAEVSDYDVFDLTIGRSPLEGVNTPVFDETKVPIMPQGGFLGALWTALVGLVTAIAEAVSPVIMGAWLAFVGFIDAIFTYFGWTNGFSTILSWIAALAGLLANAFTWLISLFTSVFNFFAVILTKFFSLFSTVVTNNVLVIQGVFDMLGGVYTGGVNIWFDLDLSTWVTIGSILYCIYLIALWDEKGTETLITHLTFIFNILHWLMIVLLTVVQLFIRLITALVESIPVVE